MRHGKRQHGQWPYSRSALKRVLGVYTACPEYRAKLIEETVRIDLEGNAAGAVTAGDAEHASKTRPASPTPPSQPKRLSLDDVRRAARQRRGLA